jgi:hypothetical protein
MNKILLKNILENSKSSLANIETAELKVKKLKILLEEEQKKNQNFDLISGTQKGLTEMFQEINKKELLEEIDLAIKLLEHFESTSSFGLKSIPMNKFSNDMANKFDIIKSLLISIIMKK